MTGAGAREAIAASSVKLAPMKNAWLLGTHLVAALVGAGIASAYCVSHWNDAVRGATLKNDVAVSAHYGAVVEASRDAGNDGQYDRALRDYVKVLDMMLSREPRSDVYNAIGFDKAVALARLALLDEKRGENVHAVEHLKEATLACETVGRNDCTAENLRDWAVRVPVSTAAQRRAK